MIQIGIAYTEKGAGLHDAIRRAGLSLREENGQWVTSHDIGLVQSVIDGYTIAQCKTDICNQILSLAKRKFDSVISGISSGELAGWPILREEEILYRASGNEADCPSIAAEAADRGIPVATLAAKVRTNSATFNGLRGAISGASGRHRDAVMSLTTFAEVLAYQFTDGWPV
jgi:hypothetical protein